MYKESTVFIIGAAASIKYGFPLGDGLTDSISAMYGNYLKGNSLSERLRKNFEILKQPSLLSNISTYLETKRVEQAALEIHKGLHGMRSVDRYLHVHQNNGTVVFLGKLAIAASILKFERQSSLFKWQEKLINSGISIRQQKIDKPKNKQEEHIENLTSTWINIFFNNLSEGYTKDTVKDIFKNVSIICFNYDRCIEFYIMELLVITFSLDRKDAAKILSTLNIIHPYGTLGDCINSDSQDYLPFGNAGDQPVNEYELANRIITFTESTDDNSKNTLRIADAIAGSTKMIILGFGFEQMNMDLLNLPTSRRLTIKKIHATAYHEIEVGQEVIRNQLYNAFGQRNSGNKKLFKNTIKFFDNDCEGMLLNIRRDF